MPPWQQLQGLGYRPFREGKYFVDIDITR